MKENDIIQEQNNSILNIDKDKNDLSFTRLVKLQNLVKKESTMKELCKKT